MKKQYNEIPIGGIGVIASQRVIAQKYLPKNTCDDCCFSLNAGYNLPCPFNKCNGGSREDKTHVYFVKVQ